MFFGLFPFKHLPKTFFSFFLFLFVCKIGFSQSGKDIFLHTEYQFFKYDYLTIGLGFQPKNSFVKVARKHPKYYFNGWTINYSNKLNSSDWGTSIQRIVYSATANGPLGIGLEANYKSINHQNHFGIKPLIGLSFPIVSIMYAYNFDFYKTKSDRIKQSELIVGLHIPLISLK